ncbi:MAG TPA: universal stress protein, partial [Solirubrobacteraceae bacterium]|nr:universal stress protein [Solirubrobacteraceae bacterium]
TDGSETATQAVRQAIDLARALEGRVELVSAYEPVSSQRLREQAQQMPQDAQCRSSERRSLRRQARLNAWARWPRRRRPGRWSRARGAPTGARSSRGAARGP